MFFWESLAFSMIQQMLAIWSLVPLPFPKPAWTSGSSQFTYCWSLAWRILSITLLACEMSEEYKYVLVCMGKNLNLPEKKVWPLFLVSVKSPLGSWKTSAFVCLGALHHTGWYNNVIWLGASHLHIVLRWMLVTSKRSTMWLKLGVIWYQSTWMLRLLVNQSRQHDDAPIKSLDTKAHVNSPGWQYSMHIITNQFQESNVSWLHRERKMEALTLVVLLDSALCIFSHA